MLWQIENEYGNVMGPYGAAGKSYVKWSASMALSLDTGVPWVMCQQGDAPDPIVSLFLAFLASMIYCIDFAFLISELFQINTCNGFYCDQFTPNSKSKPKMWTENWTGW